MFLFTWGSSIDIVLSLVPDTNHLSHNLWPKTKSYQLPSIKMSPQCWDSTRVWDAKRNKNQTWHTHSIPSLSMASGCGFRSSGLMMRVQLDSGQLFLSCFFLPTSFLHFCSTAPPFLIPLSSRLPVLPPKPHVFCSYSSHQLLSYELPHPRPHRLRPCSCELRSATTSDLQSLIIVRKITSAGQKRSESVSAK